MITFGIAISSFVDNLSVLSPNGESCTMWALVIKSRKWSSCFGDTYILVEETAETTEPQP